MHTVGRYVFGDNSITMEHCPGYARASEALLNLIFVDPILAMREIDHIRNRQDCMPATFWCNLDLLSEWAKEEWNK